MAEIGFRRQNLGERRRREIDRVDDMTAKDTTVSGRHLILGAGEVTFDVTFPVTFVQRPIFHYGAEMDDNFTPVTGSFPGISRATVVNWDRIKQVDGAFDGYFTGATISAQVEGTDDQQLWVHWSFRASGLRNPVKVAEDLDDTL